MWYAVKKILEAFFMPWTAGALLLVVAVILRARGRRRAAGIVLVIAAMVPVAGSLAPVSNGLLLGLESAHRPVLDVRTLPMAPRYVVVLGSGYEPRAGLPATTALGPTALMRLVEGLRLLRQLPDAKLIVSGGAPGGRPAAARGYELAARELGLAPDALIVLDQALDTATELQAIRDRVDDAPVLLVTSAGHMPRSMAHASRVGLRAFAAPAGPVGRPIAWWSVATWLPSGSNLQNTEAALHEYLGLVALRFGVK